LLVKEYRIDVGCQECGFYSNVDTGCERFLIFISSENEFLKDYFIDQATVWSRAQFPPQRVVAAYEASFERCGLSKSDLVKQDQTDCGLLQI
jgi:hypothetical protein